MLRYLIALLIIVALVFSGYEIGQRFGKNDVQNQLIENYSFVKEIAELATLEVSGVTTFTSTNVANDGSFTDEMRKMFTEQTVHLSIPYTAKYGVHLQDSSLKVIRKDSVWEIHLPAPQLLSFELRLDRMDASNKSGLFSLTNTDLYTNFQKKLYVEGRAQLEKNQVNLNQTIAGVSKLLDQYFKIAGIKAICLYDLPTMVVNPKN